MVLRGDTDPQTLPRHAAAWSQVCDQKHYQKRCQRAGTRTLNKGDGLLTSPLDTLDIKPCSPAQLESPPPLPCLLRSTTQMQAETRGLPGPTTPLPGLSQSSTPMSFSAPLTQRALAALSHLTLGHVLSHLGPRFTRVGALGVPSRVLEVRGLGAEEPRGPWGQVGGGKEDGRELSSP